jgi:beta-glucosidase
MPFAVPTSAEHLPAFEPRAESVVYDLWHGYRRLQRQDHAAAFPFGFGLSYSSFAHGELQAELLGEAAILRVSLTVINSGSMAAAEVVQVYLEPPGQAVERPARTLVGFGRLQLEPGQAQRLELAIPLHRLAYFDEGADAFRLEEGLHRVVVARHAEDPGLAVEVQVGAMLLGP